MTRRWSVVWLVPAALFVGAAGAGLLAACDEVQDVGSTAAELDAAMKLDASPFATDATDAADATLDGGADADADAGPVNLLPNPSFEDDISQGNCGTGWNYEGTGYLVTSAVSHDGRASCSVCALYGGGDTILHIVEPMPDAGATLVPAAWFRGVDGSSVDGSVPTADVTLDGCFPYCGPHASPLETPDAAGWELQNGDQVLVGDGAGATFFFDVHVSGGCVLVDDVSVFVQ